MARLPYLPQYWSYLNSSVSLPIHPLSSTLLPFRSLAVRSRFYERAGTTLVSLRFLSPPVPFPSPCSFTQGSWLMIMGC